MRKEAWLNLLCHELVRTLGQHAAFMLDNDMRIWLFFLAQEECLNFDTILEGLHFTQVGACNSKLLS